MIENYLTIKKIDERGNRNALIKEINDSCERTFGMNLIESHGHAFLSHSDSNKDFLRKLNEVVKKPDDTDPMRDLLQIVLQVRFIIQSLILVYF